MVARGIFYNPIVPGEEQIPFLPWTFFIYILVYIVPGSLFLVLNKKEELIAVTRVLIVGMLIPNVIWIFYPVQYGFRPDPALLTGSSFLNMIAGFYALDTPAVNSFPSLHVTYAFLCYFVLHEYRPRLAPLYGGLAVLISLSTLTFKQHYISDVAAGFLLAVLLKIFFIHKSKQEW